MNKQNLKIKQIKDNAIFLLKSPSFIGYNLCSLLTYGAIAAWLAAGTIILQNIVGLSATQYGWSYFLTGCIFILGSIININIVNRIGIQGMVKIGIMLISVAALLMLVLAILGYISTLVIVSPILFLFFGASFVFPNSFAGAIKDFTKTAGTATTIFCSSCMLAGVVTSAIIAVGDNKNQFLMALMFSVCTFLVWISYYSLAIKDIFSFKKVVVE